MKKFLSLTIGLTITPSASAELVRQSSFAGTPGEMHIDLLEDSSSEGWLHIRVTPGHNDGVPIARTNGVTLFAPKSQLDVITGLNLDFYADLSGGGFLISTPEGAQQCSCGAGFKLVV